MKTIPINDLSRIDDAEKKAELDAIARVYNSGWYILGPEVRSFEDEFASYIGSKHCVGVGNGTDALELALRSLGVGPGDEVATVANAGMYSTAAIYALGAKPRYVEICADTMTMDPEDVREKMGECTRAIIVTHLYGQMADMPAILDVSRKTNLPLIEDCAQAHGAVLNGTKAGNWGDIGCFSFYPTKNLGGIGDGGCLVTSSEEVYSKLIQLRQYGWKGKYCSEVKGGRNSRLDEIQAAILRSRLPLLDHLNGRRRKIARIYSTKLAELQDRLVCTQNFQLTNVSHLYVIRTRERENLSRWLMSNGVSTDVHYPIPDHHQPFQKFLLKDISLPVTENVCEEVLTLPCFPGLAEQEIDQVLSAINKYFAQSRVGNTSY
ncbi:MAG: DegT/DnrJ/EryC1/StrS family aminotransferase [Ignavibacteriales bacterium]|nr:DegT/DnrJ/EryC1/StrS family aminotransferase [Ignavibacteriales bacterium]